MSRRLFKQMTTEWRSNLWLVLELMVVSVVMWYVTDYLFVQGKTYSIGMGMDAENVFVVQYGDVPSDTDSYVASDSTDATHMESRRTIYDRLRSHPDVEIAAITALGVPYEMNLSSAELKVADETDSLRFLYSVAWRYVTPEYFELLRIHGAHGESPQQLRSIIESGASLLTPDIPFTKFPHKEYKDWKEAYADMAQWSPDEFVGRNFLDNDSNLVTIGGLVNSIQRMPFEAPLGTRISGFVNDEQKYLWGTVLLRVKPEAVEGFAEKILRDNETTYRSGNTFVENIYLAEEQGHRTMHSDIIEVRNHIVLMVFLMVSIFLGLLGTFWFRTQQRVSEIAIRKVNGATRGQIFRRLMGEGLMLLTVATVPAIALDWLLTHFEMNASTNFAFYFEWPRFTACVAIVYALLALMVLAGIWFPASRAMKIDAASALKDE